MDKRLRQSLLKDQQVFKQTLLELAEVASELLKPLSTLDREQIASLRILTYLLEVVSMARRPQFGTEPTLLKHFQMAFEEVCPGLGEVLSSGDPCFDSSVAYISALKKCEDEGRSEEECFEAFGAAGASHHCAMERIEEMKEQINEILGGLEPPWPAPFPLKRL